MFYEYPWFPKLVPRFATRNFALASGSERELNWGIPALSLPSAGGGLHLQQAMCGASDTRERAHDAGQ